MSKPTTVSGDRDALLLALLERRCPPVTPVDAGKMLDDQYQPERVGQAAQGCYELLESLELTDVSRAFLLREFGSLRLSDSALSRLATALAKRLKEKGLSVADCLG